MERNKKNIDMSVLEIRGELMKKGYTLTKLGLENGLAKTTLRNALDKHYPNGEKIIAKAIGKSPEEIWPSRY